MKNNDCTVKKKQRKQKTIITQEKMYTAEVTKQNKFLGDLTHV